MAVHGSYGSLNICFINEHTRAESIRQLKREIELAHDLECDAITVHPGLPAGLRPWYPRQNFWDMMLRSYEELLEFACPRGVTICCENIDPHFVGRLEHFESLLTHFRRLQWSSRRARVQVAVVPAIRIHRQPRL